MNLYGFANGDPVNFSDPFGLCVRAGNLTQSQGSDCERFAQMVHALAKSSKTTEDFVRATGKMFAGFPGGKLTFTPGPVNRSLGLRGTGFRPEMNDLDNHPWRHASAFIVAGYDLGESAGVGLAVGWEAPFLSGASMADIRLGMDAVGLGASLKKGWLTPAQAAEWIREYF